MAKQHETDWDNYNTYREDTLDWRVQRDKNEKFYFGEQWSQSMGKKLEDRGQSDIVINKIRPLLRMRVSMMIANKPIGRVLGVNKEDINSATLLEEFADWHLYNSDWQFHLEKVVMGQQRVGLHWLTLTSDPVADYGNGELKIGNESYRHVFCDKSAGTKWDFSDAARIFDTKQRRPEDWMNSLPPKIRKTISNARLQSLMVPDDEIRWSGESQHRESRDVGTPVTVTPLRDDAGIWIREMDVYERVMVDVQVAITPDGLLAQVSDADGNFPELIKQQIAEGNLDERSIPQPRIKYRKNISGKMLLPLNADNLSKKEDILPIDEYPLIPIVDEDSGNSMPFGEIDFQKGIQEIVNMATSLTLLNASLSSNMKILVDSGRAGITNLNEWKNNFAVPGSINDIKVDPVTGKFPIQEIKPQPLNQAWFALAQSFGQELENQITLFSVRQGDPSNAPDTFAATLQLGQWAQDILRIPLSRLELGLERLYNLIFAWSPHYYTANKLFYTLGEDGEPLYQTINLANMEFVKAKFRIRAGSTLPSQTVSELGILQSLAQIQPALIGSVIDRMPGLKDRDKKEIKQTIDIVQQLTDKNGQLEETVNVLQQQMQHLSEQNFALQKEQALGPLKREVDKTINILRDGNNNLKKAASKSGAKK